MEALGRTSVPNGELPMKVEESFPYQDQPVQLQHVWILRYNAITSLPPAVQHASPHYTCHVYVLHIYIYICIHTYTQYTYIYIYVLLCFNLLSLISLATADPGYETDTCTVSIAWPAWFRPGLGKWLGSSSLGKICVTSTMTLLGLKTAAMLDECTHPSVYPAAQANRVAELLPLTGGR